MTRREDEGETTKALFFVSCRRVLAALETRFERHTLVCRVVRLYFRKTRLFSSHEPSPAKHSQNIPKTFSKRTVGHVAFRVRWRSIIGLAHERKRRSIDGSRFGTFFASTHILRPRRAFRQPTFFRRVRWTFSTARRRFVSSFRTHAHEPPRRVRHPHPAQPRTCASPRPAPRASRPSSAPRATSTPPRPRSPSSRRRNASTPPNTMRGACAPDTPLRHANATPTNATRANPPAGTRKLHRARPPPPTAPRSSPSRRRAAPFPARASADGSCFSAPRNNRSRPRRAPETARARAVTTARAPRGRCRHSNVRGDATRARRRARVRAPPPLRHDARPQDDTRLTRAPLFQREPPFAREKTDAPPTRFWRARASRPRARASAAAARCRFSVTPPAFA